VTGTWIRPGGERFGFELTFFRFAVGAGGDGARCLDGGDGVRLAGAGPAAGFIRALNRRGARADLYGAFRDHRRGS